MTTAVDYSPEEILAIERASCESDLWTFVRDAWQHVEGFSQRFSDSAHIRGMCLHLEAVTRGDIKKLIINIPPGCMKSLLCGVFWPAWVWAGNAEARWLHSSYSDSLPIRDNGKLIRLLYSDWYKQRWPHVSLVKDNVKKIELSSGGWKIASGIGGLSTGEHPHYIVLDDPHKVMEAESDAELSAVIEYGDGVLPSRGAGLGAATVLTMQRISQRDLSGHWLDQGGWEHLCLPMEFDGVRQSAKCVEWRDERNITGELLWPNYFTREILDGIRRSMGSTRWAGQYGQKPAPPGGSIFKREWFEIVPCIPIHEKVVKTVRSWDRAATVQKKNLDPDWTAGIRLSKTDKGRYYVEHVARIRESSLAVEASILRLAGTDGRRVKIVLPQDPGQAGKDQSGHMARLLAGYVIRPVRERKSKEERVNLTDESFAAQAEAGNVKIIQGPWNAALLDELEVFPNGTHDDQVDALANGFNECSKSSGIWAAGC